MMRPQPWRHGLKIAFAALLSIAFSLVAGSQATAAEPPSVESLKQKAEADLSIAVEGLRLKYLIALERLQKQFAEGGDLDAALAIKKEIDRANELKPSLFGTGGDDASGASSRGSTLSLSAKEARLGNGTQFDSGNGLVKGWSRYGAFAAWTLKDIEPGTYMVTLNYRSGNLGGGGLSIRTSKHDQKFSIAGVGSWADPRTHELGKLELAATDHLTIVALQGNSREMIYIESITLERVE